MSQTIRLRPWISVDPRCKGLRGQVVFSEVDCQEKSALIAILSLPKEQLNLIASFLLESEEEDRIVVAYLSEIVSFNDHGYRFVYVPQNKAEQQSISCLADLIRDIAHVTVSDASSSMNRLKEKKEGRHFVVVNGREVYEVGLEKQQIELVKKMQSPLLKHQSFIIQGEERSIVDCMILTAAVSRNVRKWECLLGNQQSWSSLSISMLQTYKSQLFLSNQSSKYQQMSQNHKMLSKTQLQLLHQNLIGDTQTSSSFQVAVVREVVSDLMERVRAVNSQKTLYFCKQLQNNLLKSYIPSFQTLDLKEKSIVQNLDKYQVQNTFVQFIKYPKERQLLHQQINRLNQEQQSLDKQLLICREKLKMKNAQIGQLKAELSIYSGKLAPLLGVQQQLIQNKDILQQFRKANAQLRIQIEQYVSIESKSKEKEVELNQKLDKNERQNQGLLQCLHQLTQQNLSLHNKVTSLTTQIQQLKIQIHNNNQIETRALCSIQNQAQIKTRLNRYEQYVKQLKIGINSFKKLQTQKFNYILAHNHTQYQNLQKQHRQAEYKLTRLEQKNRQYLQAMQCERIRVGYLQRYLSVSHNEVIAQCSEQNTDRSLQNK